MPPRSNKHDTIHQDIFELLPIVAQDVVKRSICPESTLGPKALRKYISTLTLDQLEAC